MQDSVESSTEQVEALVNTLHIDGATLSDATLSGLSSSDLEHLEQLADLQAELDCINSADIETGVSGVALKQMLDDDDIVETEIGEQVVEIEAEEETEEILPDCKDTSLFASNDSNVDNVSDSKNHSDNADLPPPLRPLTIAPKSATKFIATTQIPFKTANQQQIVFIQSPGTGQSIKLMSSHGQTVAIPTLQNKHGVLQLRTVQNKTGAAAVLAAAATTSNTIATTTATSTPVTGAAKKIAATNKNILTKVIVGTQANQMLLTTTTTAQSSNETLSQVKLTPTKTITLAQAQQMGLFSTNKVQQLVSQQSPTVTATTATNAKQTLLVNKTIPVQTKTIKVVPQVKSPTKILPAPVQGAKLLTKPTTQRVVIKQAGQAIKVASGTGTVTGTSSLMNQVIRIPTNQGITPGQIHQINVPGKGVQYIRFMTATTASNITTTTTTTAAKVQKVSAPQVVPVVNRTALKINTNKTPQNVIKVVPLNTSLPQVGRPVVPKPIPSGSGQRILIPAATSTQSLRPTTIATIPASALGTLIPSGNNVSQIVMLPAQYIQQLQSSSIVTTSATTVTTSVTTATITTPRVVNTKPNISNNSKMLQMKKELSVKTDSLPPAEPAKLLNSPTSTGSANTQENNRSPLEPNGIRPRKPCNCTKSLCLKLYCDCFANGEFCHLCNCMNCYNNLEKEEERQRAIRNCLERNPNAFRPKIGKGRDSSETAIRKHTKGCNCKRSGCLKNYCECYEAKIACSSNCKCVGCRNIEDSMEKKNVRSMAVMPETQLLQIVPTIKSRPQQNFVNFNLQNAMSAMQDAAVTSFRPLLSTASIKVPSSYITNSVIEATNACMITVADVAERNLESEEITKKLILEEFGKCLVAIINCTTNLNISDT